MPRPLASCIVPAIAGALATLLPAAATAQATGSCGQTAALTESLETPLAQGFETLRRFVTLRRNEPRYLEFTLDAGQAVTMRTEAPAIDPAMALYDSSGQLLASDDDSGGGVDALVSGEFGAGLYCLQVRPIGSTPVDFAEFVVVFESGIVAAPGQELPCSTADTRDLASGLVSPLDPMAFDDETAAGTGLRDFRLSLAAPMGLGIDLASGEFDTVLEIFDANGESIASNDDFSGTDSRVEQALAPGDYCVRARSFGGSDGRFSLAISEAEVVPPALPCGDPARTGLLASGFGPDSAPALAQGDVPSDLLQGWFSLNLNSAADVRIDARSTAIDTMLELYDSSGWQIDGNDDGPEGTDSRLELALDPGDYCVVVRGYGDAAGPFELSVVPAGMEPPLPEVMQPDPAAATEVEEMGVLADEVRSYTIGGDATLWASFTLEGPASVIVNGMSVSSEFSVSVFGPGGETIGAAGPVPAMSPADMPLDLEAGTYLVALTNHGGSGTLLRQITVSRQ